MSEDFSDHPISLNAIRAEKLQDGKAWTPRDVLIDTLRRVDGGEVEPDSLVVIFRDRKAGINRTKWAQCGPDVHTLLGVIDMATHLMKEKA